ncbi:MAG: hypothetical protein ACRCZI_08445 [Cetobacterium sp.]
MDKELAYIKSLLNKNYANGFKQIVNNPKPLNKVNFITNVLPNIDKYYITDKADGIRCFLHITNTTVSYITGNDIIHLNEYFGKFDDNYVFDCEIINEIFYIFDVILYKSENCSTQEFNERYKKILEFEKSPKFKIKTFYKLNTANYQKQLIELYKHKSKKLPYTIDGVIFTEGSKNYSKTINLKWKPPNLLTIDFLAIYDKSNNGLILTNGMNSKLINNFGINYNEHYKTLAKSYFKNEEYIPIPFCTSLQPNVFLTKITFDKTKHSDKIDYKDLNGKIVELSFNIDKQEWIFHKIRDDRTLELQNGTYYGNNFKVAEDTFASILNPLLFADMMSSKLLSETYFHKQDDSYKNVKQFNNNIKQSLIEQSKDLTTVMDIGFGRGGDLYKYIQSNIKHLIVLEKDRSAIEELIHRKHRLFSKDGLLMNIINVDLNTEINIIEKIIKSYVCVNKYIQIPDFNIHSIDAIYCNFAMHYFTDTKEHILKFVNLISNTLKIKGKFYTTLFDKDKVQTLLNSNNGKWQPDNKYIIEAYGKKNHIRLKLPFSKLLIEEDLIDIEYVKLEFTEKEIHVIEDTNFGDVLNKYDMNFKNNFSESDKTFIGLYRYIVFQKIHN